MLFNIGDRIIDNYLGKGTIISRISLHMFKIYFDNTPPYNYNCGENPTTRFVSEFKLLLKTK